MRLESSRGLLAIYLVFLYLLHALFQGLLRNKRGNSCHSHRTCLLPRDVANFSLFSFFFSLLTSFLTCMTLCTQFQDDVSRALFSTEFSAATGILEADLLVAFHLPPLGVWELNLVKISFNACVFFLNVFLPQSFLSTSGKSLPNSANKGFSCWFRSHVTERHNYQEICIRYNSAHNSFPCEIWFSH